MQFFYRFPGLENVLQAYGTSETSGIITRETVKETKLGSVGKVLFGNTIKVKLT